MTHNKIREDLLAIWQAGVDGVCTDKLIRNNVTLIEPNDKRNIDKRNYSIEIGNETSCEQYSLSEIDRIIVVGGGKASGGMAESLTKILEPISESVEISGWVNVPNDCVKPLNKIYLHAARPAGINEPTEEAVTGTNEIIRILKSTTKFDLCICLISGGGSALLPAPVAEISLQDKCGLIRFLNAAGATIQEINSVRKIISRIKGGRLKQICRGKRLISLILSDVIGDPLDVIASGMTVDSKSTAEEAVNVLRKFMPNQSELSLQKINLQRIFDYVTLQAVLTKNSSESNLRISKIKTSNSGNVEPVESVEPVELLDKIFDDEGGFVRNIVIGNNALAVEAAGMEAERRGYKQTMFSALISDEAENVGRELIQMCFEMVSAGLDCLVHGGEPVVKLVSSEIRGVGGRNQQLVLAAVCELIKIYGDKMIPLAILSAGTDGEDGPTDAAGAWIDPIAWELLVNKIKQDSNFNPESFLNRNDAYNFFKQLNTLIKTGITGTNVCDLRIVIYKKE